MESNVIIGPWPNSGKMVIPPIYVIMVDGRPYMKDNAIRTYKSLKSAGKSAAFLTRWRQGAAISIGEFAAVNVVSVEATP